MGKGGLEVRLGQAPVPAPMEQKLTKEPRSLLTRRSIPTAYRREGQAVVVDRVAAGTRGMGIMVVKLAGTGVLGRDRMPQATGVRLDRPSLAPAVVPLRPRVPPGVPVVRVSVGMELQDRQATLGALEQPSMKSTLSAWLSVITSPTRVGPVGEVEPRGELVAAGAEMPPGVRPAAMERREVPGVPVVRRAMCREVPVVPEVPEVPEVLVAAFS